MRPAFAAATVRTLIDQHAAQTPDGIFHIAADSGKQTTWQALAQAMPAVARLAESLGVGADEPLAFMMGNGWTATQLILGAMYNGRVVLPLNLAAGDAQLAYALKQSGCRAAVVDGANADRLRAIIATVGDDVRVTVVDRDEGIADDTSVDTALAPTPESRALLMYTSGTTGMPKGVVHTHTSLLAGGDNVVVAHQLTASDRALCVLPLYHINALCVTVFAPLVSGSGVVMPPRFRTERFWQDIAAHDCTWFSVVPTLISYLLGNATPPPDCQRLRFGRSASAPLSPSVQQAFEDRFNVPIIETMGLTETAAQILSNPLPPATRKIGSPGIAYGNDVIIVDATGNPRADNTTGELAVRGDNVMREYHDNPDETAATFTADGWLLTGDLGHRDSDGYFFITGRRKELIIKGGENIAPREIDEALLQLEQVVDAAAFARPCNRYGQRVEACVILAAGSVADEAVLVAHCNSVIGAFKSPDRIYFVDEFPRGASGKVQRLKLAAIVEGKE